MKIDAARQTSPVWRELKAHYEARLAQLRMENDNPSLDAQATAELRGRIDEVKKFIALESVDEEIQVAGMQ